MRIHKFFAVIFASLLLIGVTAFTFKSVLDARTESEWPKFTMVYRIGGANSSAVKRLTWYSKNHWISEIMENKMEFNGSNESPLLYTGAKYEFIDGSYLTFDPNTGSKTRRQINFGTYMSPAEWIFPGYEETIRRSKGFQQTTTTLEGNHTYRQVENRYCAKKANGALVDPTCDASQQVVTELTFNPKGIPLFRSVSKNGQVLEQYQVTSLEFK